MFATSDPNFTIIAPGGCNAKCSFCSDPMNGKPAKDYLGNLAKALATLPAEMKQVSISGGEPTISRDFMAILWMIKASQRFRKVVLTTNGAKLAKYAEELGGLVDHINISRHAIGTEENREIFGTDTIPSDKELIDTIVNLNKQGIDVTLNHVYSSTQSAEYDCYTARDFVEYAKKLGASAVAFRYDQHENDLSVNEFEQEVLDFGYKKMHEGECPVCRSFSCLISGMPVMFKSSMQEPADELGNTPYELIYHINGTLCTDWAAKRIFDPITGETTVLPTTPLTAIPARQAQRRVNLLLQNSVVKKTTQLLHDIDAAPPKIIPRPPKTKMLSTEAYVATGQPDTSGCHALPQTGSCGQPINRGGC